MYPRIVGLEEGSLHVRLWTPELPPREPPHLFPILPWRRPSPAHHESRARDRPCGSLCAAQAGLGKQGAGGLGCRKLGQQRCWRFPLVQGYHRLWQEESRQQSREARAPTAGGDHHSPLKLDQSEKSEVLRGSGSGLTTSSIWKKELVSPGYPVLSSPTHLAQVGPKADGWLDRQRDSHQRKAQPCPGPVDCGQLLS